MILITGATGFLGAEVTRQLLGTEQSVRCLRRRDSIVPKLLLPYKNIEWAEADLLDPAALEQALEGIGRVYHCAAFVSLGPRDKNNLLHTNIEGTANLVNLCLQKSLRLMHVSSVAALGEAHSGKLITENTWIEDTARMPVYAISKYEGEMEVWRGIAEGLDAVIVNPSLIIGKNCGKKGSGQIFEMVRHGLRYYSKGSIGIVDVEDVARAMIALMNTAVSGERYIINAESWPYKKLFGHIAGHFGVKAPFREAKPWMLGLTWRVLYFLRFFGIKSAFNRDTAKASVTKSEYANEKVISATGIRFKPVADSIKEVCNAMMIHSS